MKRKLLGMLMILMALGCSFISCSDNDNTGTPARNLKLALTLDMPLDLKDPTLLNANAALVNVQTGAKYTFSDFRKVGDVYTDSLNIPEGTYNVTIDGNVSYLIDSTTVKAAVKTSEDNVHLTATSESETVDKKIALNTFNAQNGFVISEIFYTGTLTPAGKPYTSDQYIKIANNSDTTMYADGLAFVESAFLSTQKEDYTPDIMNQAMTIDAIYLIPGSGKEHPVKPGQELLLALDAKNHKELNANSVDLSKADFEFYDESSDPHFSDDDNPDVPNLDSWYNYSLSYFILHTGGYKTYALARPEVNKDTFLANYRYTYTYDFLSPNGTTFKMKGVGFKLPNAWIVDAVNLSVPGSHKWNIVSSKLDAGWTYCGKVAQDKNRYGKAVRRKRAGTKFVDTNNSTNDFTPDTIPSLLE
ncbi:DUF4876 domain-containing protein [Prevotella cerevisiae]|uniref:DUF4876 domain-containing protein n=1 Tax=Segatella cerevisiae TaxID=2053716 RepID=A0ABT1BXP4_9BACT|nr:DUF4876 domain-containing protein [Segatella cerevisiae]MCO6025839.1 DUF4876 domain-containing protein [Segatella cerevisiae]